MSTHCFGRQLERVIDYRPMYRDGLWRPAASPHRTGFDKRGGIELGGAKLELVDFGTQTRGAWKPLLAPREDLRFLPQSSPIEDPTYHGLHLVGRAAPGVTLHGRLSVKGYSNEIRIAPALQSEWAARLADAEFFGFRYRMRGRLEPGWAMPRPSMYVERRGGTAHGWYFAQGEYLYALFSRRQMDHVLPGEWVIDPAITRESIQADADDCYEFSGSVVTLSGYGATNANYVGRYANADCHTGVRFLGIPIPQGSAMNSASLRFYRLGLTGTPTGTIYGDDVDSAANAWATGAGAQRPNGSGVTRTTASVAMTFGAANDAYFATNDIGPIVAEIVQRPGFPNDGTGNIRFVQINTAAGTANNMRWRDFQNADSNEPEFDADYAATDQLMAQVVC